MLPFVVGAKLGEVFNMSVMSKKLPSRLKRRRASTPISKGGPPQHTSLISDPAEGFAMQDAFEDVFVSNKKKAKMRDKRMSDMMKFLNLKKAKHGGTLRGVGQALKGFGKAKYSNKLF